MNRLIIALGFVLLPVTSYAQDRSVKYDIEHLFRDAGHVVSAPTHASRADARTLLLVAGSAAALLVLDEPLGAWLEANPGSIVHTVLRPLGESSKLNLVGRTRQFLIPLSAALYASGWLSDSDDLKDAGLGCLSSNLTTTLSRSAVSLLIGRARPLMKVGAFRFEVLGGVGNWDMRSFPGGHAANVWSCASYFNNRFDLGLAEPAIYAVASGVALARVADEAHWLSDTFVGSTYGYAVGKAVAARYANRARERTEQSMQPSIVLTWRLTF